MAYQMGGHRPNAEHLVVLTDDDFEALTPAQREAWQGYTYKMTYETWDQEALEAGDTDDRGWIEEGSEPYDSLKDVLRAAQDHSWLEWSDSNPDGKRSWLVSEDEEDYRTGARTQYNLWIERADGLPKSQEEMDYIDKAYGIPTFGRMRRNARGRKARSSNQQSWRDTPQAVAAYQEVKDRAQRKANETGFDYGIEANDVFKEWHMFMLPQRKNRTGHELRCEVVMCEDLSRCQPGHGPEATHARNSRRPLDRASIELTADRLLGTHWFRSGTRGPFHLERSDWVRSGKAACGVDIKNPSLTISSPMVGQTDLCRRCLAKLMSEDAGGSLKRNPAFDPFTRGYLEAALFSTDDWSREDGGDPLDKNYSIADFAPEAIEKAKRDCDKFYDENLDDLREFDDAEAGADFWFTRCGHGVGYWDGDYPEPQATRLTNASKKFGNVDLYVGDDGLIYSS